MPAPVLSRSSSHQQAHARDGERELLGVHAVLTQPLGEIGRLRGVEQQGGRASSPSSSSVRRSYGLKPALPRLAARGSRLAAREHAGEAEIIGLLCAQRA